MRTGRAGLFIRKVCNACQLALTVGNDRVVGLFVCLSVCLSVCMSVCLSFEIRLHTYSTVKNWICLHLIGSVSKSIFQQTKINDDKMLYYRSLCITIDSKFNRCQREVMT